jgi:LacI family transcriptional regulator
MRDVAERAGVSLKTVSRVINGEPTVAADLAARVEAASEALGYRHNLAADLRGRGVRPSTIGLLIQDVSNEFSSSIYRAVEDVARTHRVQVLASNLDEDPDRERMLVASLITRRVDGLILVPAGHDHRYLEQEQRFGTPVVFLDRLPVGLEAATVVSDNRTGALAGVRHLIRHGHRRIGFLGEASAFLPAQERYEGYAEAVGEAGHTLDAALVRRGLADVAEAEAACIDVLSARRPPTALFTAHNRLTIGAIRALRRLGAERSVALVGFDDFALADLLQPAVTVVAQDPRAIGRLGAEVLFRQMGGDDGPPEHHVVATRLIPRGTGELRPGRGSR